MNKKQLKKDKKDLNNWDSKLSYQEEVIKDVQ